MSPSPNDIRRYAQGLIDSYGQHSLNYADEMIQAYLANGDAGALDVWRQVKYYLLDLDPARFSERLAEERESVLAD